MKTCALIIAFMLLFTTSPFLSAASAQETANDVLPSVSRSANELQTEDGRRTTYANMYYRRCMAQPMGQLSEATQDMTCMCHSVHMIKALEIPELELLATGKGSLNVNPRRMNVGVYAPCIEFAIAELEREECYDSDDIRSIIRSENEYQNVCDCIVAGLEGYLRETSVPHVEALTARPQGLRDPIGEIRTSYEFAKERGRLRYECANTFIGER